MSVLRHGLVPPTATGYQIERSLRFNNADSTYLGRTPGSAGNRRKWTFSVWLKRTTLGDRKIFVGGTGTTDSTFLNFFFDSAHKLKVSGYNTDFLETTQVFRDVSAWYHLVLVADTDNSTSSDRLQLYVNGSRITAFGVASYPTGDLGVNNTQEHNIGRSSFVSGYFDGYTADVHFIDGSALTPSSFGENDTDTGVWKPKAYTGSYGTNGFKLTFSDNSGTTATTLGKDTSGNGNNWTPNNFSVTAGAGNDSLVDTPTPYGTDTGAGGEVRGNYATLNPLKVSSTVTLSNGNLNYLGGSALSTSFGTIGVSSGKWYWEATPTGTNASQSMIGIANDSASLTQYPGQNANSWSYYGDGTKYTGGSSSSYGATFGANDVIGVALDMDAGTITFYKNGVSQGQAFSSLTGTLFPAVGEGGNTEVPAITVNFGQRPFAYTAPSGFKALCTTNLPTPTIGATAATRANKYFSALPYTATGNDPLAVTGVGFQPDLVWIKVRNQARDNTLFDAVRGATKYLISNTTAAEGTSSGSLKSFDADGFTLGNSFPPVNWVSGDSQMSWNWKANGAGSSNTAGSITSTVSANTTAGFSIVTFTAQTTGTATVGHGLGVAPKMIITKPRTGTYSWASYHASLGNNQIIFLNLTDAASSTTTAWNDTNPTSSVFTLGTRFINLGSHVAYCFAEVAGYSTFGSYTGNGSADGPFVYTGFRPAFLLVKRSSASGNFWILTDNARRSYNAMGPELYPNASDAEATDTKFDYLSNGFKLRSTATAVNGSGDTYIYAAFAEVPAKFSLAR